MRSSTPPVTRSASRSLTRTFISAPGQRALAVQADVQAGHRRPGVHRPRPGDPDDLPVRRVPGEAGGPVAGRRLGAPASAEMRRRSAATSAATSRHYARDRAIRCSWITTSTSTTSAPAWSPPVRRARGPSHGCRSPDGRLGRRWPSRPARRDHGFPARPCACIAPRRRADRGVGRRVRLELERHLVDSGHVAGARPRRPPGGHRRSSSSAFRSGRRSRGSGASTSPTPGSPRWGCRPCSNRSRHISGACRPCCASFSSAGAR